MHFSLINVLSIQHFALKIGNSNLVFENQRGESLLFFYKNLDHQTFFFNNPQWYKGWLSLY